VIGLNAANLLLVVMQPGFTLKSALGASVAILIIALLAYYSRSGLPAAPTYGLLLIIAVLIAAAEIRGKGPIKDKQRR